MLPGPVFNVELITTARRARYYAVRLIYGLVLLFLVWSNYEGHSDLAQGGEISIQQMARFADTMFATFASVQCIMVLLLAPTLVAAVIVDEKQRKTLHYLLASRLTSAEIVLGKLAARMLHLAVFLGVGLPVMSLLTLFGGVDPGLVFATYAGTLSTAFFLAGVSIFVSAFARRVREAIALVFVLELAWLALPPLLEELVRWNLPQIFPYFSAINQWVLATHPFVVVFRLSSRRGMIGLEPVYWMVALQLLCGVFFTGLAVWRLRPLFLGQEAGTGKSRLVQWVERLGRWRFFPRRPCGDEPMLWKEMNAGRARGVVRLIVLIVVLVFGSLLGYGLAYWGGPAVGELLQFGYSTTGSYGRRSEFNGFLRFVCTTIYILWLICVAAAAASSVTQEREGDTWTSLMTTPLTGTEILRAKMLGTVWSMRALGLLLAVLWTAGLASSAVHPLGFLAVVIELGAFTWFAAALGTYVSLRSRTTLRAQAATILILLFCNGMYMLCCIPMRPNTILIATGCTPFIQAVSLLSLEDVRLLAYPDSGAFRGGMYREAVEIFVACFFGVFVYAIAAFSLTTLAFRSFDRAVDRPQRDWEPVGAGKAVPDEDKVRFLLLDDEAL